MCTFGHAEEAAAKLDEVIAKLQRGEHQTPGHRRRPRHLHLRGRGVRVHLQRRARAAHRAGCATCATIVYLTNEYDLGDFGVGGLTFEQNGFVTSSQLWTESLFKERGVLSITRAHVQKIEEGRIFYETLDGDEATLDFDFAMLLPPFRGQDLQAFDRDGTDITSEMFAPSGFLKVDADYTAKPYAEWKAKDWPSTYVSPRHGNVFGIGIAFAPPHQISVPRTSPRGTVITPAPPRTGMPSGLMGRAVASSIADMIKAGTTDAHAQGLDVGDGRGLRRLRRCRLPQGHGRVDDDVPRRPGLRAVPRHGRSLDRDHRRDRPGRRTG